MKALQCFECDIELHFEVQTESRWIKRLFVSWSQSILIWFNWVAPDMAVLNGMPYVIHVIHCAAQSIGDKH